MVNQSPHEHSPAPDERPEVLTGVRPDGAVARLLDAAAAPAEAGPQPGEEPALAAFRASHRTRRIPMFSYPTRAKAAVAATIGAGTLLFAGVGGAAAGVLPDHAQDTASTVLGGLGFDIPRANEHAGVHPAQRGAEEDATADEAVDGSTEVETDQVESDGVESDDLETDTTEETDAPADPEANDHGQEVSSLAHDDSLTGADKGAAVSEAASSKSKAGEEHSEPEQSGSEAESHRPATAGNDAAEDSSEEQDADEQDEQSDGSSTADEKSGAHSDDADSPKTRP